MTSTDFRPDSNGFAFANSFEFSDAERTEFLAKVAPTVADALRVIGPLGIAARVAGVGDRLARAALSAIPHEYGLCGGMAFAALDYFKAGESTPRGIGPSDQPVAGSPLRDYLWQRLLDSWRLNGATFLEWKARLCLLPQRWPLDAGPRALRDRSRTELAKLEQRIDADQPTPLGLVGAQSDPFRDHQVLAYAYEPSGADHARIFVYDSNCPGLAQTIDVDLSGQALVAAETCPRPGSPLRGFFCETYEARLPP